MANKLKKIFCLIVGAIILINSIWLNLVFAEPFYFHSKIINEIKNNLSNEKDIKSKITYLENTYYKISLIDNSKKELVLRDIDALKKDLIKKNIREYTFSKYWNLKRLEIIKKYKSYFDELKSVDVKADIHINYIKNIEEQITSELSLNEDNNLFKAYIYLIFNHRNKKIEDSNIDNTLNNLGKFKDSKELLNNKTYYSEKFTKLLKTENINPLAKNDFEKIYNKIVSEKISPNSDYVKWFQYWYAKYIFFLTKNTISLQNNLIHTKQKYALSCEANSIKDVFNYYYLQKNTQEISEDSFLSILSYNTWAITRDENWKLIWSDPDHEFVWSFSWKQSVNPNNFSGYWVYANPIIKSTQYLFSNYWLKLKKTEFSEKEIINSIANNNPVMFWYLSEVKIGKKYWYQTKPVIWNTKEWKEIKWYIWEHTWVIIWFDINKYWWLDKIYFYEGKTNTIQSMDYNFAKQAAGFFNQMITVENFQSKTIAYR